MKITDYLSTQNIFLDVDLPDKLSVLKFIAKACAKNGIVSDSQALLKGLQEREETMSTGVGKGLAFPHTISAEVRDASVLLIRPASPVDFDALDKKAVEIILALIFPKTKPDIHVRLLARISRLCREPDFLASLKNNANPPQLWQQISQAEEQIISY